MNNALTQLQPYPFEKLRALLGSVTPNPDKRPIGRAEAPFAKLCRRSPVQQSGSDGRLPDNTRYSGAA